MSFLTLIQNDVCHPGKMMLTAGPMLFCSVCQKGFHLYDFIKQTFSNHSNEINHFRSSELAQAYFEWTGDEHVPMNFTLYDLEGIYSTIVVGQSLSRVQKSLRLLKALNAPFTTRPEVDRFDDMDTFLVDFLNIINEHPDQDSNNAKMILDMLIRGMHDLLSSKEVVNPFETYFNDLVPYVKNCAKEWTPLKPIESSSNLAYDLLMELQTSTFLRKQFGKFSIAFDVIHIMVSCYVCSVDMKVVGNWVLDFIANVCRGSYFWKSVPPTLYSNKMKQIVSRQFKQTMYSEYNRTFNIIRKGESYEYYSDHLKRFQELQMFLRGHFCTRTDSMSETAFGQIFPAFCFDNHADYLGFLAGSAFLVETIRRNKGFPPKGTCKQAKYLHRKIQNVVGKIQNFEKGGPMLWTSDTLELFLASDPSYEDEIVDLPFLCLSSSACSF